jgi:RNA polymerase sigma-70 factor (ECF subfamily)
MGPVDNHLHKSADPDVDMVHAFLSGDRRAFDTLAIKYKDKIFSLCYRFLGDEQDAGDAAQDIFFKVYKSLKKFRFESKFQTWLYRIAVNTCRNKISSRAFRNRKKTETLDSSSDGNPHGRPVQIADTVESPSAILEKKERMARIQEAINTLPGPQKTVIILRDIEGFSYDEIAAATGFNLGTVKSKISRARQGLRKKLRGVTGNDM